MKRRYQSVCSEIDKQISRQRPMYYSALNETLNRFRPQWRPQRVNYKVGRICRRGCNGGCTGNDTAVPPRLPHPGTGPSLMIQFQRWSSVNEKEETTIIITARKKLIRTIKILSTDIIVCCGSLGLRLSRSQSTTLLSWFFVFLKNFYFWSFIKETKF
jgi:hypothetical protein